MVHRRSILAFLLAATAGVPAAGRAQGLLVERAAEGGSGSGFTFQPAMNLTVNGKDRVLILGVKPESATPVNKLQNTKIGTASLILDAASGVVLQYSGGGVRGGAPNQYFYPGGIDKKAAPAPKAAWAESTIGFKKSQQDKTPLTVPASRMVAFLAGGQQELASICMDEAALALIGGGGADAAFAAQLELTSAAVAAFGSHPAMAPVEKRVLDFMNLRLARFGDGVDSTKSLTEGLRFAELSAKAYPNEAAHKQARDQLASAKAWLDKRTAILRALAAGAQWDAFLVSYRDFEKHQGSFPDLSAKQREALKASLDTHWKSGKERMGRSEFRRAWAELRTASFRQPSNNELQRDVAVAWSQYSRLAAVDRQNKRKQLSAGELDIIEQTRVIAERYKQQNKLEEAFTKIGEAERMDPESLPVLLTKASILGAREEYGKALATLDTFDLLAVDKEREPGNKLRTELVFMLADRRAAARKKLAADWQAGRYHAVREYARQALLSDDRDPGILYYAGASSLLTRQTKDGVAHLRKYLEVSDSLDADAAERAAVTRMLAGASATAAAAAPAGGGVEGGEAHWFSGAKLPRGVFYCPVSLAFTPKVDRISASNKLSVKFNWEGARLRSIVPTLEKGAAGTGEKPFAFAYAAGLPHAFAVDAGDAPRKPSADAPDVLLKEANVLLPNNPLIDVDMAGRLAGKPVTVGVAGNRFFHPFVWERPYYFAFRYDERGRVKSARQLPDAEAGSRPPVLVEFEWSDLHLDAVRVFQLADASAAERGPMIYERTMQYQNDRLMGEQIRAGQKDAKIKYEWGAGGLVSAECDKDETLDNRSREVFFAGSGAKAGK